MSIEAQGERGIEGRILAVGVDIAKRWHVAVIRTADGTCRPLRFEANRNGLERFLACLEKKRKELGAEQVVVDLEATGH